MSLANVTNHTFDLNQVETRTVCMESTRAGAKTRGHPSPHKRAVTGRPQKFPSALGTTMHGWVTRDYTYDELPTPNSFRILELKAGVKGCPITCKLRVASLDEDELSYEAVSYHWGPKNVAYRDIFCDGGVLRISPDLWDGLQRLREPHRPRFIWIDAICINQLNTTERGHQVKLMRQIYRRAQRVLIWAGNQGGDHAKRAFSHICRIANVFPLEGGQRAFWTEFGCEKDEKHDFEWQSIRILYQVPWFWRVWIIQEVALARSAVFIWGDTEIDWHWVGLAASWICCNDGQAVRRRCCPACSTRTSCIKSR